MSIERVPITVSIVIATYNRAHLLPQCLDSMLGQTRSPDEIVLVDDGSTDDTTHIATQYAGAIRYFRQDNQGRAAALNFGMRQATGTHFCFFDDDDVLLSDGLQAHLDTLSSDPDADYSYSPNLIYDDDDPHKSIWDKSNLRPAKHCQSTRPETLFVRTLEWGETFLTYIQGMLIPARCMDEVGPFDESLLRCQDYDIMLKLARRYRGISTKVPTFVMRNHQGSRGPAKERHSASDRMALWAKYDRQIILPYRQTLALSEYLPIKKDLSRCRSLTPEETFAALLQRSRIMFSHGLFEHGVEDIELIGAESRPSRAQLEEIEHVVTNTANIEQLHFLREAPVLARRIAKQNYVWSDKKSILTGVLKGFYWALRSFQRKQQGARALILIYALAIGALRRAKVIQ